MRGWRGISRWRAGEVCGGDSEDGEWEDFEEGAEGGGEERRGWGEIVTIFLSSHSALKAASAGRELACHP